MHKNGIWLGPEGLSKSIGAKMAIRLTHFKVAHGISVETGELIEIASSQ